MTTWSGLLTIWTRFTNAFTLHTLHSSQHRLLFFLLLPVLLPGNVYANSEAYAPLPQYSQRPIQFCLNSWTLAPIRSPVEVLVTCTTGLLMVQGFASNVCGCIVTVMNKSPECVIILLLPFFPLPTEAADVLQRGCDMEIPGAPEYRTLRRCRYRTPPAHFNLDAWRDPTEIHQEAPQCRPGWTRRFPSCWASLTLTPVTSYPTSLRVSATSIHSMWYTGASEGHVLVMDMITLLTPC